MRSLIILCAVVWLGPVLNWGADAPYGDMSNEAYQGALQAYLQGDFDQAILLDSQALQIDSKNKKASDLLVVLIKEKEQNRKTEIWIGTGRTAQPQPEAAPVISLSVPPPAAKPAPRVVKKRTRPAPAPVKVPPPVDNGLESRVETILSLMGRNASDQYHELTASQVNTEKKVDETLAKIQALQNEVNRTESGNDSQTDWLIGFLILILMVALGALGTAVRARQEVKRLRILLEGNGMTKNVLPLDGTFR